MPIEKLELNYDHIGEDFTDCKNKINELIDFINALEQDSSEQMERVVDRLNALEYEHSIHAVKICELEGCSATKQKEEECNLSPNCCFHGKCICGECIKKVDPLSCPWCQTQPVINADPHNWWYVSCENMECNIYSKTRPYRNKQEAISAWNKRSS